ncbi:ABC transporter substrate binding protein [Desulfovibrio inopinatus]|uniref:ABC transporter substrate binding protein n=1 Tax=Desulfovibrio inopinatus TaxID=102109 RepID=UPI00146F95D3|nr:ABC transporter substrate binding protein [Desulfovibrio inopinatus]
MDSKRFFTETDFNVFYSLLRHKLKQIEAYDVILTADDNALQFVLQHREELFPHTPLVFCGVNNQKLALSLSGAENITGVIEAVSMKDTINTMLSLQPKLKTIYAIVDSTPSGQADLIAYKQLRHSHPNTLLEMLSLQDLTWDEFGERLRALKMSDALLLLSAYRDKNGVTKSFEESLDWIVSHAPVPTFHLWEHGINRGLIGGKVISQFEQGKLAAQLALDILHDIPAKEHPVIEGDKANRYFFDYAVLDRFDIDPSLLPSDTIFLNRPHTIWEEYKTVLFIVLIFTAMLILFCTFLAIYTIRLRNVRRMLARANFRLNEAQRVGGLGDWEWDPKSDTITWSENLYAIFGIDPEYVPSSYRGQLALFHPESAERLDNMVTRALEKAEPYELELSRTLSNGTVIHLLARGVVETDEDGKVVSLFGSILDTTRRKTFEDKLTASEERYRQVVSSLQETLSVISADGTFRFANPRAATNLCGLPDPAQVIGKNIREFVPADQAEYLIAKYREVAQGKVSSIQETMVTMASHDMWFRNSLTPIAYGDQDESCVLSLSLDITEQVNVRKELESIKIHLERVLDATTDAIWELDLTNMTGTYSSKYATMLGYLPSELPPAFPAQTELLHPDDKDSAIKHFNAYIEQRSPYYRNEFRMRHSNGEYIWIESSGKIVEWSSDGKPAYMIGNNANVTESRQTEQQLAEAHKRLSFHMENSPLAVIEWKNGTHIKTWSKQAEHIFGWKEEEVVGKNWTDFELVYPEDQDVVGQNITQLFEGKIPFNTIKNRNYRKDKTIVHCQWYNSSLLDAEGNMISILSQVADVTELKSYEETLLRAKEQAEKANQVKSEFLANMSHEIRTPLNGILGMLQVLSTSNVDEKQRKFVEMAIQSSKRLHHLLSDILDISRIEANRINLQSIEFDLGQTIQQACALFEISAKQTGLYLTCVIDPQTPAKVIGDPLRLTQVLNNLLGNAFKFTKSGEVHLEVYPLRGPSSATQHIHFSVTDTGIGIPDDKITMLFQPFSQVSGGFKRDFQGAGLGLTICKQLIKLMNGTLVIISEVNVGTTVHFSIPLPPAESHECIAPQSENSPFPFSCPPVIAPPTFAKVLLVEDDDINTTATSHLLESCGYTVTTAKDGKEALERLKTHDIDVILMDVQMPVMDGIEATQAIRQGQAGQEKSNIPIIALTACAMPGDKKTFLKAGMNAYLIKPVELEAMCAAIETAYHAA